MIGTMPSATGPFILKDYIADSHATAGEKTRLLGHDERYPEKQTCRTPMQLNI